MFRTTNLHRTLLILMLAVTAACAPAATPATPVAPLSGGVLATFAAAGDTFNVWVTNPTTIDQLMALQAGDSAANIPNGKILAGPGAGDHNAPWSWHLDPEDIEMAELTIEVCDGAPSYVEEHLTDFTDTVGRYCPWSAQLTGLQDLRD